MSPTEASLHHLEKMNLTENLQGMANSSLNPSSAAVQYLRRKWLAERVGGFDNESMLKRLEQYNTQNPHITIISDSSEDKLCIVLITPFMRRVNQYMREAAEIVFVDSTSNCDQLNMAVTPLMCATAAGAMPLAVLFTSSQDEMIFTKGILKFLLN